MEGVLVGNEDNLEDVTVVLVNANVVAGYEDRHVVVVADNIKDLYHAVVVGLDEEVVKNEEAEVVKWGKRSQSGTTTAVISSSTRVSSGISIHPTSCASPTTFISRSVSSSFMTSSFMTMIIRTIPASTRNAECVASSG